MGKIKKFEEALNDYVKDKCNGDHSIKNIISVLYDNDLLSDAQCKKALIKYNYGRLLQFYHHESLKIMLAEAYHVSYSTVHRYIYKPTVS